MALYGCFYLWLQYNTNTLFLLFERPFWCTFLLHFAITIFIVEMFIFLLFQLGLLEIIMRNMTHRAEGNLERLLHLPLKWNYLCKTSQTTKILLLFQEQNLPKKKKSYNFLTAKISPTSDNAPARKHLTFFKMFQNIPLIVLTGKKKKRVLLCSSSLYLSFIST